LLSLNSLVKVDQTIKQGEARMKRIVFINILFLLLAGTLFCAEDTIKTSDSAILHRSKRPFFVYAGPDGLGVGGTIFGYVDVQAGSYIFVNSGKIKVYLLGKNSSPFIGIGIGDQYQGFGGNGESNDWTVVFAGWQFTPFNDRGFFEFSLQWPTYERNSKAFQPTRFSFSVGARIF
jgi:hypothetical protein